MNKVMENVSHPTWGVSGSNRSTILIEPRQMTGWYWKSCGINHNQYLAVSIPIPIDPVIPIHSLSAIISIPKPRIKGQARIWDDMISYPIISCHPVRVATGHSDSQKPKPPGCFARLSMETPSCYVVEARAPRQGRNTWKLIPRPGGLFDATLDAAFPIITLDAMRLKFQTSGS